MKKKLACESSCSGTLRSRRACLVTLSLDTVEDVMVGWVEELALKVSWMLKRASLKKNSLINQEQRSERISLCRTLSE